MHTYIAGSRLSPSALRAPQDGVCTVDVGFVQMPDVATSRGMWLATLPINNAVDVQVATTIAC